MRLTVSGNINEYYVQTLCLLFFPNERFSKTRDDAPDAPVADVVLTESDGFAHARVSLSHGGKSAEATCDEPLDNVGLMSDARRIAVGKAFFEAGKALTGKKPVWGILTGVRPSKLALKQLFEGKTKTEVKTALSRELFVSAKKAALVTDVASVEKKIILKTPPRSCSVYIAIPFCPTRCGYCSFVSVSSKKLLSLLDDYLARLKSDISRCFDLIKRLGLTVSTVYIGGGTPTTLDERQLKILLDAVTSNTDVSALEEFTVEAGRPDTVNEEKMRLLLENGVSRVSINTQTLNDEVLMNIGRHHTAQQYFEAFETAKKAGFKHINTDLIAGLPGESYESFSDTVDRVIALGPDNITVHTLCIKSAADFAQNAKNMKTGSDTAKCVDYARAALKKAGYAPYYMYRQKNTVDNLENVGYARPGAEGLYNIYMMEEIHSVFAVGASAVTRLVSADGEHIERIFEYKYPYEYLSEDVSVTTAEKELKITEFYKNHRMIAQENT